MAHYQSLRDIPQEELQRLNIARGHRGSAEFLYEPTTRKQYGKANGVLKNCAGYLFSHDRLWLINVAKGDVPYNEDALVAITKRMHVFKNNGIPPIFPTHLEGKVSRPYKYHGIHSYRFPCVDYIINEFSETFVPSQETHTSTTNTACRAKDVIYFAAYAFRSDKLDETIPKEYELRIKHDASLSFKDDRTFQFIIEGTNRTLKFLEKSLLPLARKHRKDRIIRAYGNEPLDSIIGEKFWYTHYDTKDKQRIVAAYVDRLWEYLKEGNAITGARSDVPALQKMRYIFPAVEDVIRESKDENVCEKERWYRDLVEKVQALPNARLFAQRTLRDMGLPEEQHYYDMFNREREQRLKSMSAHDVVELYKMLPRNNPLVAAQCKNPDSNFRNLIDKRFLGVITDSEAYKERGNIPEYALIRRIASETSLGPSLVRRLLKR